MGRSEFSEAAYNAKDIDILECTEYDIFWVMKEALLKAFDKETTFDMRLLEQMELIDKNCIVGIVTEKDKKLYPFIQLGIGIKDGYYDEVDKQFKLYKKRDAEFDVTFTPFNCCLEKHGQKTGGIYSGSDKELTAEWRNIMKQLFPKWEEKFKAYLETVKKLKIEKAQKDSQIKIEVLEKESANACKKAEEEYLEGLKSIGL